MIRNCCVSAFTQILLPPTLIKTCPLLLFSLITIKTEQKTFFYNNSLSLFVVSLQILSFVQKPTMAGNTIVVFDFDKTIIECDSDNWVVDELGFTDLFNQLLPTMPWNSLMVTFLFSTSIFFFFIVIKLIYLH